MVAGWAIVGIPVTLLACIFTPLWIIRQGQHPILLASILIFALLFVPNALSVWWTAYKLRFRINTPEEAERSAKIVSEWLAELHSPSMNDNELLVVRASGDEATGLLIAGQFLSWLTASLSAPSRWRIWYAAPAVAYVCCYALIPDVEAASHDLGIVLSVICFIGGTPLFVSIHGPGWIGRGWLLRPWGLTGAYLRGGGGHGSLRGVPDEPAPDDAAGLRAANSLLRGLLAERDAEIGGLRELVRRLELRLEELERRLRQDSSDSGTPASKDSIAARERRKAERADPDRGRRKDRTRGGQPGHEGKDLARDPRPDHREEAPPPAECRRCKAGLEGAEPAAGSWAQVIDVLFTRFTTEWALPGRECRCCGEVTIAPAPPGAHAGSVSYGPALNAAAIVLTAHANVPPERAAQVIAMLLGVPVSAGWVDKAASRLAARLREAGFEEAMEAALAAEGALAADETPVNVLDRAAPAQPAVPEDKDEADPGEEGKAPAGAPHILAVRTLDERLTWLRALASRRKGHVTGGIPARFTGVLVTDGYRAYQGLLSRISGIQQCCQHVIRRCRAVMRTGPGSLQSWAADVITILREAHQAVQDARARGDTALDQETLGGLRDRYDKAAAFGAIHNRLRDWHSGNHPGYALARWLQDFKEQVFLFTRDFTVSWTSNAAERAVKAPKRHQAVSGYWHTLQTLARWCLIRSYLTSAANHGETILDAIRTAIEGKPWLPPVPAL